MTDVEKAQTVDQSRMERLAAEIESELSHQGATERATAEKRYLKSELDHLGVNVPTIRRITRRWLRQSEPISRADLLHLVEQLWSRPVHETRKAAVEVLITRQQLLEAKDLALIERLIRESRTWALLDDLAARVAEPVLERSPVRKATITRWASDADTWVRRAALLVYLLPLRGGGGRLEELLELAEPMLVEKSQLIRKAIGWVLRETAKHRPEEVVAWLEPRLERVSGLTLREAARHLPEHDRERLIAIHRSMARHQR